MKKIKNFNLVFSNEKKQDYEIRNFLKTRFAITDEKIACHTVFSNLKINMNAKITYIYGLSGSGKSQLLNMIRNYFNSNANLEYPKDVKNPIIDSLGCSRDIAIKMLTKVGLGEVYLFLKNYIELSDGQKFRYRLALSLLHNPKVLIIDDFLECVDSITAQNVAYMFSKICLKKSIQIFVATVNDNLMKHIQADQIVNFNFKGVNITSVKPEYRHESFFKIKKGSACHINFLKKYHYFNNFELPSKEYHTQIMSIFHKKILVGTSIFISPYPKGWEKEKIFRYINKNLLIRSLTVIHPSFRGMGLSTSLLHPKKIKHAILVRSALYNYIKIPLSAGYVEYSSPYNQYRSIQHEIHQQLEKYGIIDPYELFSPDKRNTFVSSLSKSELNILKKQCVTLYIDISIDEYKMYYYAITEKIADKKNIEICKIYFQNLFSNYQIHYLLSEAIFFKMGTFYRCPL